MIRDDLRFGVIGWGYWGPKIARNLDSLPHAMVSMVADTNIHRLASLTVNQPGIKTTALPGDIFRSDIHADPVVSYRFGAITIPHIDWIEPLRLECEDFANAIRLGTLPRAHGGVGLGVVEVLAAAQETRATNLKQGVK